MRIDMDTIVKEAGISDMTGKGASHEYQCHVCQKGMTEKAYEKAVWVHMTTGIELVPIESDCEDTQGCFAIGSSCAAKLRKAFKARGLNPKDYIERPRDD